MRKQLNRINQRTFTVIAEHISKNILATF